MQAHSSPTPTGIRHRIRHALWLALSLAISGAYADDTPFTESVVIFNTACARCHEGECSGRLSFGHGSDIARNHILRHYGPATGEARLQRELSDILAYMKDHCAFYPLHSTVPAGGIWDTRALERLSAGPDGNMFVPLGRLQPGRYRLAMEFARDMRGRFQVVSETFEMTYEAELASRAGRLDIPFTVDVPGEYYFRMYPHHPAGITRLSLAGTGTHDSRSPRR